MCISAKDAALYSKISISVSISLGLDAASCRKIEKHTEFFGRLKGIRKTRVQTNDHCFISALPHSLWGIPLLKYLMPKYAHLDGLFLVCCTIQTNAGVSRFDSTHSFSEQNWSLCRIWSRSYENKSCSGAPESVKRLPGYTKPPSLATHPCHLSEGPIRTPFEFTTHPCNLALLPSIQIGS